MRAVRTILCAFRFDDVSMRALGCAAAAARKARARLIVASIQPSGGAMGLPAANEICTSIIEGHFRERLAPLVQHLRAGGLRVRAVPARGYVADAVQQMVERYRAEAVYVPDDQKTGWDLVRDGSLADELRGGVTCRVVAVSGRGIGSRTDDALIAN